MGLLKAEYKTLQMKKKNLKKFIEAHGISVIVSPGKEL